MAIREHTASLADRDNGGKRDNEAIRPVLRAKQLSAFKQIASVLLVVNILPLAAGAAMLPEGGLFSLPALWLVLLSHAVVAGGVVLYMSVSRPAPNLVASALYWESIIFCAVFGTLYGLAPHFWLESATELERVTAMSFLGVVMALASVGLAVMPPAAYAFLAMSGALGGLWLGTHGYLSELLVWAAGCAALGAVSVFAARRETRGFRANIRRERTVREQRFFMSLLLKEFEPETSNWLWEIDAANRLSRVSARLQEVSQAEGTLNGANFLEFLQANIHPSANGAGLEEIETSVLRRLMFRDVEVRLMLGKRERWWRLTGRPVFYEDGRYAGFAGAGSDISEEKLAETRIAFLAHNDPLTGLANRAKFTDSLNHCVARLERYGTPFAVLYLDLDQFKLVNDVKGHLIGDKLLTLVGQRMKRELRETDIVARVGGDEFAILLPDENDRTKIEALAERLIGAIAAPYEIEGEIATIGLSVGVAMAPNNGTRANQILRNADLALYRAKEDGRGLSRFFETRMDADNRERRLLENEMRQALEAGEFELYFQPVVGTESKNPVGFEALVRWNHPIRGMVPPSEFIPIAEQTGLICDIGDWTVMEACRTAATWPDGLMVAVNLSAKHFQTSDIVATVRKALEESGLDASRLEIEVTESLLIKNQEEVRDKLVKLREIGASIALDDFGTGYSSLSYLLKFPFDKIKIDRSFVDASSTDDVARDILRTIAALGSTLQMKITAEGVETNDQVEFLREIACHHLQGYFFAKPLKSAAVAPYLLSSVTAAAKLAEESKGGEVVPLRKTA